MPDDAVIRCAVSGPDIKARRQATVHLRLLATSDIHVSLSPFDYFKDTESVTGCLSLTASLIAKAREEAENCLLFDNGDFLNGGPLGDYIQFSPAQPNPVIQAMNCLNYDAVNLGNHEFSSGIEFLENALESAQFPVISANTFTPELGAHFVQPWVVLNRRVSDLDGQPHLLRIGVVGVLPPQTTIWDKQAIAGRVVISDMQNAIVWGADAVKRAGADVVVILAHCGIGQADAPPMAEDAGIAISGTKGIDALILGHAHLRFPDPTMAASGEVDPVAGKVRNIPTIMPGAFGSHLGVIDLDLCRDAEGWHVTSSQASLRATAARLPSGELCPLVQPDKAIVKQIASFHEAARIWVSRPIAQTASALHSYFSMITDVPAIRVIHQAQIAFLQKALAETKWADMPVVSATAPFKAGGRGGPDYFTFVPPGEVLLRHLADLYLYPNTLTAVLMRGAELRRWLELSSSSFLPIEKGQADQRLLNPEVPPFHFDSLAGVTYEIDLTNPFGATRPSAGRIRELKHNGLCVTDDQLFIMAVNSYRASGSGGYLHDTSTRIPVAQDRLCRDILEDYLRCHGDEVHKTAPNWRFAKVPDTSVILETSPAALHYLQDVDYLDLTPLGMTPQGFLQVRLAL
ncbi:bifunctional 2',3'-cyclic-nucleotide 2'-phosphodiesterase/3'-nucleotidase [Thioclava sp. FR2]|uniref:bifunctional 2',3'-cyclic-nucleotide 2'-phosphodiesterase/3'-nucleotidase n=1 Tax=Thioclava sp. FR2 TaxID=3445780 RepID=UPI003EBEC754